MAKNDTLTAEYVRSILDYNPETGVFVYKERGYGKFDKQFAGKEAGFVNDNGYLIITINSKDYRAHRLAYLLMMGKWPEDDVDHINGVRTDNRWYNLRDATRAQNHANKKIQSNNSIGYKGVHVHKQTGKYRAQIRVNGKRIHIGLYDTPEQAHNAYTTKADELFGEYARGK